MRTSNCKLFRLAAAALLLLSWTATAGAYCLKICDGTEIKWPIHEVTLQLGKKSFSSANYLAAIYAARDAWNQSPGFFTVYMNTTDEVGIDNGYNEVWFSVDQDILEGAPGRTISWLTCGEIEEADVVFDANWDFTSGTTKSASTAYGGMFHTFRTGATHELGHVIGLCHNSASYNIMGGDSRFVHANGGTLRNYAGASGIAGEIDLYGVWPPSQFEDVSVVHWKYGGVDGEYSKHRRTRIYDTSDNSLEWVWCGANNAEPCFRVTKGQTVKVEFTYENLGRSTQNVDIGYYLSTNSLITTLDTFLTTGNISALGRPVLTTNNTYITIPSWVVSGRDYYIGAIVNYNRKFVEAVGQNNATYIGIHVD
jgi:hypothetical protein